MKTANRYAHYFPEIPPSEWGNLGTEINTIQKNVKKIDSYIDSKFRVFLSNEWQLGKTTKEDTVILFECISDDFWEIASTALAGSMCGKMYGKIIADNSFSNSN